MAKKPAVALLWLVFIVKQGAFLSARRKTTKNKPITSAAASFILGYFLLLRNKKYLISRASPSPLLRQPGDWPKK
ncbi:MAG: hypothetical protein Q4G07_06365 [Oscillospiraceae bacterium]|nr:hypothetical protein [Oscillospiraceae bacterium]